MGLRKIVGLFLFGVIALIVVLSVGIMGYSDTQYAKIEVEEEGMERIVEVNGLGTVDSVHIVSSDYAFISCDGDMRKITLPSGEKVTSCHINSGNSTARLDADKFDKVRIMGVTGDDLIELSTYKSGMF